VGSYTRLPSVFPNTCEEEPKYHGIIDGKMETPPKKKKYKESTYILFYFFIAVLCQNSVAKTILLAFLLFEMILIS